MEEPDTSISSGAPAARRLSRRARERGSVVDIAGFPLRVRATAPEHQTVLDTLFGSLAPCRDVPLGELVFGRRPVAVPGRRPDEEYRELALWHVGERLFIDAPAYGMRATVTPTSARVGCDAPTDELGLRQLFRPIATHLLAYQGAYIVHGAAVRRAGFGALVLGESGKGKSTLALAALEHGWTVLADDLVALRRDGTSLEMRGIPKPLALPGDLQAESLAASPTLAWDARDRRHVGADRLDAGAVDLARIIVVDHGDGDRAALRPVEREEVMSLLLGSFASTLDAPLVRRFFPVAMTAARLPGSRLLHARDPQVRLREAVRALDELADGTR